MKAEIAALEAEAGAATNGTNGHTNGTNGHASGTNARPQEIPRCGLPSRDSRVSKAS